MIPDLIWNLRGNPILRKLIFVWNVFLGIPSYKDRVINKGSIFHVQTYGLNAMGSYANQLNPHERWLVAAYVMKLKSEL